MEENTQPIEQQPVEETSSFSFVSDEQVAAMQQPQAQEQPTEEVAQEPETRFDATTEGYQEQQPDQQRAQDSYANDLDREVLSFLSERLGKELNSLTI